jgi:transcriptional regulator with XRE-family HTH domain
VITRHLMPEDKRSGLGNSNLMQVADSFLAQITQRMQDEGVSRTDLAIRTGVSKGRISQIFGSPGNLTIKTMMVLAGALDMEVSILTEPSKNGKSK